MMSMPVWLKEKLFLKRLIHESLIDIENYDKKKLKLLFPEHHLSHAASAYYPSSFDEAAILTIDGVGEWATASICHGKGKNLEILKELKFPHSLGLLYSAFTYYCGFKVNSGEYKLMGLAPYGEHDSAEVKKYVDLIKTELTEIKEDGSIFLNQYYFNYSVGLRMAKDDRWEKLFGIKRREDESDLTQPYCNLALAIQIVTEEVVIKMAREAQKLTGSKNLCMAGGVALNCVANGKLQNEKIFENIFIQPAAGDAGGAVGAALAAYHLHFEKERERVNTADRMSGSYLGPEYSDTEILRMAKRNKAVAHHYTDFNSLAEKTAQLMSEGNVVGWFQGRMEFGPRALGGRSIIADARNPEMQKKLNLKIKFREGFRPFAPSVLAEEKEKYFEIESDSPYMLMVQPVKKERQNKLPDNYQSMSISDKLYFLRSDLPSITHVDYTARIQTVHKETNEKYWKLIDAFRKITGYGVIVNTSFNVRGEPIVCTPHDAYVCLMRTDMDYLVIGYYLFAKNEQPEWKEKDDWRKQYKLD
jgi:carbamoyltransferase